LPIVTLVVCSVEEDLALQEAANDEATYYWRVRSKFSIFTIAASKCQFCG